MHELYLAKIPETLNSKTFIAPITIMTSSPTATNRFLYEPYSLTHPNLFLKL